MLGREDRIQWFKKNGFTDQENFFASCFSDHSPETTSPYPAFDKTDSCTIESFPSSSNIADHFQNLVLMWDALLTYKTEFHIRLVAISGHHKFLRSWRAKNFISKVLDVSLRILSWIQLHWRIFVRCVFRDDSKVPRACSRYRIHLTEDCTDARQTLRVVFLLRLHMRLPSIVSSLHPTEGQRPTLGLVSTLLSELYSHFHYLWGDSQFPQMVAVSALGLAWVLISYWEDCTTPRIMS